MYIFFKFEHYLMTIKFIIINFICLTKSDKIDTPSYSLAAPGIIICVYRCVFDRTVFILVATSTSYIYFIFHFRNEHKPQNCGASCLLPFTFDCGKWSTMAMPAWESSVSQCTQCWPLGIADTHTHKHTQTHLSITALNSHANVVSFSYLLAKIDTLGTCCDWLASAVCQADWVTFGIS